jgi:hypothetical protein
MSALTLSERAKHRYKIAAGFLRSEGRMPKVSRGDFYDEIGKVIDSLSDDEKQKLKSNVDWVESYDNALQALAESKAHTKNPSAGR